MELKIVNLEEAAAETASFGRRLYQQIMYSLESGKVWVHTLTENSWVEYRDPDVILVGNYAQHLSPEHLRQEIETAVSIHYEYVVGGGAR